MCIRELRWHWVVALTDVNFKWEGKASIVHKLCTLREGLNL